MVFIPNHQATKALQPSKQSLDLPAPTTEARETGEGAPGESAEVEGGEGVCVVEQLAEAGDALRAASADLPSVPDDCLLHGLSKRNFEMSST